MASIRCNSYGIAAFAAMTSYYPFVIRPRPLFTASLLKHFKLSEDFFRLARRKMQANRWFGEALQRS
jgi:hypothetical protein